MGGWISSVFGILIQQFQKDNINYRLLASTGRAAKVLTNVSGSNAAASTIHSLVYRFAGLNQDLDSVKEEKDVDGQLFIVFAPASIKEDVDKESIYIVDESSMISDQEDHNVIQACFGRGRLLKDLLDYDKRPNSKFLFVGDPCQLPPIQQYFSPALDQQYIRNTFHQDVQEAQLTEIMRQKGASDLITTANKIRQCYRQAPESQSHYGNQKVWGYIPFRNVDSIHLHASETSMVETYMDNVKRYGYNHSVFVCRSNALCSKFSDIVRKQLGFRPEVSVGDLLMVIQNNLRANLLNGDLVQVESISPNVTTRAGLHFRSVRVKELFSGISYSTLLLEDTLYQKQLNLSSVQQKNLFVDFVMRTRRNGIRQSNKEAFQTAMQNDPYLNALRCSFGYAVTCHKAQGGEWDEVFVTMPRNITLNPTKETYQWIYTAMTRAKKVLHVMDDFYIK